MSIPIVHSPDYDADFPVSHRFPMGKYSRLASILRTEGLLRRETAHSPDKAPASWLQLAHQRRYVDQVIALSVPKPIEREIGFTVSEKVALRARKATAGTALAARLALEHGLALNSAGGSHHARFAQGAGFCTFNDVAVAAKLLLADRTIARALVIDLDVHQGDGTAEICRDDTRIFTVSVHAARNYPVRKQTSDLDIALPDGMRDDAYIEIIEDMLTNTLKSFHPDIVFYNAGVDPHEEDRLGRLSLSDEGLKRRDETVLGFFHRHGIALCGVIGGGYASDIDALAERHAILFRTAAAIAG